MSGHNKWSKIKNKKGKEDAKRAKEFTKLGRAIMVAAKDGGDNPDYNAALKTAIDKAKAINMPNDNINRAIKKGSSGLDGANFEEVTYEGYGPSGTALIVVGLTDNRNRTAPEVRHLFDKFGGNLGTSGSVSFMFDHIGIILLDANKYNFDEIMEFALEANIKDIIEEDGIIEIQTEIAEFNNVKNHILNGGYEILDSDIIYLAQNFVNVENQEDISKLEKLIDSLEENDDVQNVYHNWEMNDE